MKLVAEIRKKFMMSEKVGMSANKMVYAEGNFSWWGLYSSFRSIACVVDKQSSICRRYFLLKGLYVPSVKTTTYVCNRLNNSFCAKDHKTNQAISKFKSNVLKQTNANLDGLSRGSFLTPRSKTYLHLNSHTYLAFCI